MDEKDTVGAVEIGGRTRLCGLIGNPVEHTLSPMIHNTLAAACGCDMAYLPFLVEKEITSPDGRILGKMGHSERIGKNLYKNVAGEKDQKIFESGVKYFR